MDDSKYMRVFSKHLILLFIAGYTASGATRHGGPTSDKVRRILHVLSW
jgi:hypothetical protein